MTPVNKAVQAPSQSALFCTGQGTTVSERLTTPPRVSLSRGNVFDLQEGLKQWDGGVDSIKEKTNGSCSERCLPQQYL